MIVYQAAAQRNYSRNLIQDSTPPKRRGTKLKKAKETNNREENPTIFNSNGCVPGIDIPNQNQQPQIQPYQSKQTQLHPYIMQQTLSQPDQFQQSQIQPVQEQHVQFNTNLVQQVHTSQLSPFHNQILISNDAIHMGPSCLLISSDQVIGQEAEIDQRFSLTIFNQ